MLYVIASFVVSVHRTCKCLTNEILKKVYFTYPEIHLTFCNGHSNHGPPRNNMGLTTCHGLAQKALKYLKVALGNYAAQPAIISAAKISPLTARG